MAQVGDILPRNAVPGWCYERCLIAEHRGPDEVVDSLFYVYTGNENRRIAGWHHVSFQAEGDDELWTQHVHTDRCLNRCRTMHIQYENHEESAYTHLKVIYDTVGRSDFVEEWYEVYLRGETFNEGGFTEWKRILCSGDKTLDFYRDATTALTNYGFPPEEDGPRAFKAAVVKFQRSEGLAVGPVTDETLRALGLGGIVAYSR